MIVNLTKQVAQLAKLKDVEVAVEEEKTSTTPTSQVVLPPFLAKPPHSEHHPANPLRYSDGQLNLHKIHRVCYADDREKAIHGIWSAVVLPSQIDERAEHSAKNKVVIPQALGIHRADEKIFEKLEAIQINLQTALVPYHLWAARVSLELDGDFKHVAIWAQAHSPSWVLFAEAIITVLRSHKKLDATITLFSSMLPGKEESYIGFAWRLRQAFYRLPPFQQDTSSIRSILISKIQQYMSRVWSSMQDVHHSYTGVI
ncbi:BgTH12-07033 [Blumeria graminis f. sp. triticale]|nr:BgTH12-07033 [Blumeria graminis f. sp. triticale]